MSTPAELLRLSDAELVRAMLRHVQPQGALTQSAAARCLTDAGGSEVTQVTVGRWVLGEERGEPVQHLSAHTRRALERYLAAHPLPVELADRALVDRFVARIDAEHLSVRKAEEAVRKAAGGEGGASASWISRWRNGVRPTQGLSDTTRAALRTYLGETDEPTTTMSNGNGGQQTAQDDAPPSWREIRTWLDRETRAAEMRAHEAIAAEARAQEAVAANRRAAIFERLLTLPTIEAPVGKRVTLDAMGIRHREAPPQDGSAAAPMDPPSQDQAD